MVCTLISRILGFIRIAVISAIFGASGRADVINLTFSIPNNLRKLSAEGALSTAFIPVLTKTIAKNANKNEPSKIVRNLIAFQMVLLIPLCVLCIIFAKPLIAIILAEFTETWKIELSASLFKYFILYLLFISISAVIMGALNSSGHFLFPAITPILFSICVIVSIVSLNKNIGVYSMAVGVISGGIAQILFQLPIFRKYGFDLKLDFNFRNENFLRIIKQWLPVLATSSILTITQTIAFRFASGLETGSTTALTNAIVFWQLPYGIFSASISTVLYPKMSRQIALNEAEGLKNTIQFGIRYLGVLLIPSAIFLCMFGHELIAVTIQRGEFTADNTNMTAGVLFYYSIGLFTTGVYNFCQRYFYSDNNYKTPFFITLFVAVLDIILSIWLKKTILGVKGLALANTLSFTCGLVILLFIIRSKLGRLNSGKIGKTFIKIIVSMIPFVLFLAILNKFTADWWKEGSNMKNLFLLMGGFFVSSILIVIMYKLLRIEMIDDILNNKLIKRRTR